MSFSIFFLSSAKSNSSLLVGSLGSQKASPQAAGKSLAEKYKDRQNITADELRLDYNRFKTEYQTAFGQKPTGLQKQAFIRSLCESIGVAIDRITSTKDLPFPKGDDPDFGFESYGVSLVTALNARLQ